MDRKEILALKLQMGINPAMQIAPSVLRAMWQQLEHENAYAQHKLSGNRPQPGPVTTTPVGL